MSGKEVTFTSSDVASKVEAIKKQISGGYTPPAVIGHPKHDSPRVASVVGVKLEGDAGYVQVDELTPEFAESCRKGEYKYNSPAFYANGGLRHLGILGGWNPSLKDQSALEFGEGLFAESDTAFGCSTTDDLLVFGAPADWGTVVGGWLNRLAWRLKDLGALLRGQREAIIEDKGIEAADKILPAYAIESLESLDIPYDLNPATATANGQSFGEPASPASAPTAPAAASPAAPTAREIELQAQLDEANRKIASAAGEVASRAFGERLNKAVAAGRLSPVLRTKFESLYAALTTADELSFGESDPIPVSLDGIIDSLPQIIAFGELGEGRAPSASQSNPLIAECQRRAATAQKERP